MNRARRNHGFTLVELMVATVIFLGVSIVIFTTLANSEEKKRATTTVNDIDQEAAYGLYQIGTWIRNAGSGFAQNYTQTYGCKLNASKSSNTLLPASTFAAPFATVGGTLRVAPVIVYKNSSQAGSDVVVIMEGAAGFEQTSQALVSVPTSSALSPNLGVNILGGDLLLISDVPSGATIANCLIEQVSSSYTTGTVPVTLAGSYYASSVSGVALTGFSVNGMYTDIGSVANPPTMLLIGVGPSATSATNNSLYAYDVLQTSQTVPWPIVDNVLEMHALYGLDTDGNGSVDTWQDPGTAPYDSASLLAGTTTARANLCKIKAVRVGFIMRSDIAEKASITQSTPVLFSELGTGLKYTFSLTSANNTYRYRAYETIIPIRNNLLTSAPYGAACS